jgi:hypothetical protein
MAAALGRVATLDPHACRAHVQRHFAPVVAASGYLAVFAQVLASVTAHAGK